MNILVVCQHYTPEPFRIADICEELVARGHKVQVLTGIPNYPMGRIYDGYRGGKHRDEEINGVRVHRCFTIGRRKGIFWRVINYYSFAISSSLYARRMKAEFGVVFVNQLSPVMMASAGAVYKKKHNKKMLLYCMDLWPESLEAGGIKPGSLPYKIFMWVSKRLYKSADKIAITSQSFADYFEEKFGITETEYLPQYAEVLFDVDACAKKENGTVDFMFAGNVGMAQSIDTVVKAAELTRDIPNLRWHIVGDGSALKHAKTMAKELELESVIFHGKRPISEMPEYYAMADAMLITLKRRPVFSLTVPGKLQTYMAAGKPVIGAIEGETARIITDAQCGLCCEAENAGQLAECARRFIASEDKKRYAENSLNYYRSHFLRKMFIDKLEKLLESQL